MNKLFLLILFVSNAFSRTLVATDVDMTQAIADITVIVLIILNILIILFAQKKVLSMLGR